MFLDSLPLAVLAILLGVSTFLLILTKPNWAVLLLTVVSASNVVWERLLPVEADIVVGAMVAMAFFVRLTIHKMKWKRSILDKPVMILILAGLITLTAQSFRGSSYFNETVVQFVSLAMIMGTSFIIVQFLDRTQSIQRILRVFTIATSLISLVTIVALFLGVSSVQIRGVELILFSGWGGIEARLGGIYEQPNTFATLLVLALPLGIAFAIVSKTTTKRVFWVGVSILCAASLLMSQSRSAILGALLGLLVIPIINRRVFSQYLSSVIVVALATFVVLTSSRMLEPVLERLSWQYYLFQRAAGLEPSRLEIWREAFAFAVRNPFGYGAETKYLVGEALGFAEKSVHNVFIGCLTSMGILGFLGILILAVTPIHRLWRFVQAGNDREWRVLGVALIAGLIGLWVHNLAHSIIHWMAIWIYFACVAALLKYNYTVKRETL